MQKLLLHCVLIFCLAQVLPINAQEAQLLHEQSAVEMQVQRLSLQLRCLVCQNQTLADSHAPLAQDLVQEIREMATKGMTDKEITDYLVARYGDFVRYKPAFNVSTMLLWLTPFLLLFAGALGLFVQLRHRQKMPSDTPLSKEEAQKISKLLDQ